MTSLREQAEALAAGPLGDYLKRTEPEVFDLNLQRTIAAMRVALEAAKAKACPTFKNVTRHEDIDALLKELEEKTDD